MGYFSTDGCTIGAVILSDAQKNVINQVTKGTAFINPVRGNIDGLSASISGISASIASSTAPAIFAGITGAMVALRTNLNSFVSHAERLSGISLGAAGPSGEPGINGLIGTAKTYNSVCESLTGGVEDNFSKLFNGILGEGEYVLNTRKQNMNDAVLNFVNNNSSRSSADSAFNTELAAHIATINTITTDVSVLITNDNSAYDIANQTIRNYSIGNILMDNSDPCFSGKLLDKITSPAAKDRINDL